MYDDRGLEEVGDIMSWGALVVSVQDCPDYPALLVTPEERVRKVIAAGAGAIVIDILAYVLLQKRSAGV